MMRTFILERDTPGALARYAREKELAHDRWVDANGAVVHQQQGFDDTSATIDVARRLTGPATGGEQ